MKTESTSKRALFTVGHSNHETEAFVGLLRQHAVDAVADVRSQPYSRRHPQFNREMLAQVLRSAGVEYVFLGRELGARRAERECYEGPKASYARIKELPAFREGLERVRRGLATRRIALLCAEKDPLTCHRTILVCRALRCEAIDIQHILADGSLQTTVELENRLLDQAGLPADHLFMSRSQLIEQAYERQAGRIAYAERQNVQPG